MCCFLCSTIHASAIIINSVQVDETKTKFTYEEIITTYLDNWIVAA